AAPCCARASPGRKAKHATTPPNRTRFTGRILAARTCDRQPHLRSSLGDGPMPRPSMRDAPNLPPPGPTLAALDALWARYHGSWRRLLSRGAITELRLRASFDVDLMSPWRIANKIPKGTIPDCASCDDICCAGIENVVSLRLRDIAVFIDLGRTD